MCHHGQLNWFFCFVFYKENSIILNCLILQCLDYSILSNYQFYYCFHFLTHLQLTIRVILDVHTIFFSGARDQIQGLKHARQAH
jgi:hypothetical protein